MLRTKAWQEINRVINGAIDPYVGFHVGRLASDHQGWNSHHPFLNRTINEERPSVIVEVGVWKGGSTIFMAQELKKQEIDGVVIAIDTWLGSWEHYDNPQNHHDLFFVNGFPTLYYTFLTNVLDKEVDGYVLPLPLDSSNASFVVKRKGILVDMVHIDAGHDYQAVRNDLDLWWPALKRGGFLVADDYDPSGESWPAVKKAIDDFLVDTPHEDFEAIPHKARFRKP